MSPLHEQHTTVRGRRLRYLTGGKGPPLVLCHGFMGSAENFAEWFDALSARRTLVIPDLPGCGGSEPLRGEHTAAALAEAFEPLLDDLGLVRFDLGGLCLGVPVACALLRRRPDAVGRLVLHTPVLSAAAVRRRFHLQVALLTAPGVFPAIRRVSRSRVVSDLYKRLLVEGDDVDPAAAEVNFANQLRADDRCLREWLRDGLRRDDVALVAGRRPPSLLVVAADDRVVDVARLGTIAADAPSVHLFLDSQAGHGWTAAAVERQLAAICAFLDGVPVAAGSPAA